MQRGWALAVVLTALLTGGWCGEEQEAWYVPEYRWGNVNVNYMDFTRGSLARANRFFELYNDYPYLEIEGGAGWSWGELYFFSDLENPGQGFDASKAPDDSRWTFKQVWDLKLPRKGGEEASRVRLHIQDFYLYGATYLLNNLVVGFSYDVAVEEHLFFRPFVGLHYAHESGVSTRWNGYMGGWAFRYPFQVAGADFSVTNWHEIEWHRDRRFARESLNGASWGLQGALAVWWHPIRRITAGVQYRYAYHNLGSYGYLNALIYTVKYNF